MAKEETNSVGRPTDYTAELGDVICARLAGGESLKKITDEAGMPSRVTVYSWLRTQEEFLNNYTRARDDQADSLADDLEDIAEQVISGTLDPNAARVAGDLKKWSASKLKPKKYGDKIDVTSGDKPLPQPILAGIMDDKLQNNTTTDNKPAE